jgi:benzoate/toluate 1,2-dioxygenase reductase subunit
LEKEMRQLVQGDPSRLYGARLVSINRISGKALELKFNRPADFTFSPGQRIRIIHEKGERDYSLISAPQDPHLSLLVRVVEGGALSPVLAEAEIGTSFSFTGPYGYFVWLPSGRPSVFVATGSGVAPFISMARSGVKGFVFIHGVRKAQELYERSLLRDAAAAYVACLSSPAHGHEADVFDGRVTHYLMSRLKSGAYDFYLCGRNDMIREVTLIVDGRFPGSSVYAEPFY